MKNYLQTQQASVPTAFVTKGRQRVKQHDNNIVYLKNGDEFEIELFNPTQNKVLAKISLNGNPIGTGSGIVVRPGERVFLERYLTDAKKFLFETYEVDAKDSNVQEAIKLNGIVDIEFYDEYKAPYVVDYPVIYHYHHYYPYYQPIWHQPAPITVSPTWTYYNSTGSIVNTGGMSTFTTNANSNISFASGDSNQFNSVNNAGQTQDEMFSCSCNTANAGKAESKSLYPELKETGRIEKGSTSNQSFVCDSTTFNCYCTWKYTWKILPESQKAYAKEDLKVFCTNCGAKQKKSTHKFCPNCGNKFS